jgi:hypothetical protein
VVAAAVVVGAVEGSVAADVVGRVGAAVVARGASCPSAGEKLTDATSTSADTMEQDERIWASAHALPTRAGPTR